MAVFERIAPYDERDVYVKGKKWKEIKQEPEDDYEDDNTDELVNYGMSNDNIRKHVKSEYGQEVNNHYIEPEQREEDNNENHNLQKVKKEKISNRDKGEVNGVHNNHDHENKTFKDEKENSQCDKIPGKVTNSKKKKHKRALEDATTNVFQNDSVDDSLTIKKIKEEISNTHDFVENQEYIPEKINKKKKKHTKHQDVDQTEINNKSNTQENWEESKVDSTIIDDQENNEQPKKKRKKNKSKSQEQFNKEQSAENNIDDRDFNKIENLHDQELKKKKKKQKKCVVDFEISPDTSNDIHSHAVKKDKKKSKDYAANAECTSSINDSEEIIGKNKKSKGESEKENMYESPQESKPETIEDNSNEKELKKKKKKAKKAKEKIVPLEELESAKVIENEIVIKKKSKQNSEEISAVCNEILAGTLPLMEETIKKSRKHKLKIDENVGCEETEVPQRKMKKNKKSKSVDISG